MGSKHRLLPWVFEVLSGLNFNFVMDPFSGSGCVAYLLKCMGKRVVASDYLEFAATLAKATVENSSSIIDGPALKILLSKGKRTKDFIQRTFENIFYTPEDLAFLDRISANIATLADPYQRSLAHAALVRSCMKKQPRGVFTVRDYVMTTVAAIYASASTNTFLSKFRSSTPLSSIMVRGTRPCEST